MGKIQARLPSLLMVPMVSLKLSSCPFSNMVLMLSDQISMTRDLEMVYFISPTTAVESVAVVAVLGVASIQRSPSAALASLGLDLWSDNT